MLRKPHHNNTIRKVRAHTNIAGNDEVDKVAKQGAEQPCNLDTPFHFIGHQTPYWPSIPPTSTQHDGLVRNLENYINKEDVSALISQAKKNTTLCRQMAL